MSGPTGLLLGVAFLDEFASGVPMVGAPSIQRDFAISYLETSGALLIVPLLLSFVLEPAILLLADGHARARKRLIAGGLLGMAAGALACAAATNPVVLTLATGLSFVATGVGTSAAQATLVDAYPGERERIMTRWAMLGVAGDLAAPLLLTGLAALSTGWRGAYALVAGLTAIGAIASARMSIPHGRQDPRDGCGLLASVSGAIRNVRLLAWLFGSWLCCLLDEIVVVFGSLYLRDHLGAGAAARSAVIAAFLVGGAIGLAATDRLLGRVGPRRLLLAASIGCGLFHVLWMAAPSPWLSAIAMAAVGATAAPLHPLAAAQAYAALPGRSGMVLVAGHLFDPLDIAVPLLLGWLADRYGAGAALAVLLAQPAGLAIIAALTRSPLPLDIARRHG